MTSNQNSQNEGRKNYNEENLKDDSNINPQPQEKNSETKKNDALEETEILDQDRSTPTKNDKPFNEV
jgi:hypothetical protein